MIQYILFSIDLFLIIFAIIIVYKLNKKYAFLSNKIYYIYNNSEKKRLIIECNLYIKFFEEKYLDYFSHIYTKIDNKTFVNTNKILLLNEQRMYNIPFQKYPFYIKRYFPKKIIKVINEDNTYTEFIIPFELVDRKNVIQIHDITELQNLLVILKDKYILFNENQV